MDWHERRRTQRLFNCSFQCQVRWRRACLVWTPSLRTYFCCLDWTRCLQRTRCRYSGCASSTIQERSSSFCCRIFQSKSFVLQSFNQRWLFGSFTWNWLNLNLVSLLSHLCWFEQWWCQGTYGEQPREVKHWQRYLGLPLPIWLDDRRIHTHNNCFRLQKQV